MNFSNFKQLSASQKYALVAMTYAALVLIFFYPVLKGLIISQTDFLNFISPWDAVKPGELVNPGNPHLQDQSIEFLPFFMEARRQFSAGLFPLWNPYIFAGNPLWANTQSALLFPLNIFHYILAAPIGFTISSLLKLFFGCLFTHVFVRKLGVGHGPAMLAGVAFGFCSFTVFWLNHPHTNVTPLIPLCFLMVEKLLEKPGIRNILLYALVVAFTLIAGHVEIAFLTAAVCGLYYLLRLLQMKQLTFYALVQFFAAYVVGLLLSAILIFPFIEFLFNTAIWSERANAEALKSSIPSAGLFNILAGDFFRFEGWNPRNIGYHAFSAYIGVAAIPLVLYAIYGCFRQVMPFMVVAAGSLAVGFSINPIHWVVKNLPLFSHLPLFYFNVMLAFSLSVLAALGLQQCLYKNDNKRTVLWVLLTVLLILIYFKYFWHTGGLTQHVQNVDRLINSVQGYVPWLALVLLLICLLMFFASKLNKSVLVALFIGVIYADLWWLGHDWNPVVDAEYAVPRERPGSFEFLADQKMPFRTVGYHNILTPSSNMLAKIHDVRGYDVPVIKRYHHFFNQALKGKDSFWFYNLPKYDATILPFLNILNARYLLAKKAIQPLPDHIKLVYDDEIKVYENSQAMGLAFVMYEAEYVPSPETALDRVLGLDADLSNVVVIEGASITDSIHDSIKASDKALNQHNIEYKTITSQTIDLHVESQQSAWLVLSQSYYPGWKAYINNKKTDIFAANYVLQAIRIPPGTHQVSFKYQPLSFTLGWMVSLLSLIWVLWKIKNTK